MNFPIKKEHEEGLTAIALIIVGSIITAIVFFIVIFYSIFIYEKE